jgi:hypothetical protein
VKFNEHLHVLRTERFMLESQVALLANVSVAVYRSIELGQAAPTPAFYDAVSALFEPLKKYPRPKRTPKIIQATVPQAVVIEYARTEEFLELFKLLNVGSRNKRVFREMLLMVADGRATVEDVERLFG